MMELVQNTLSRFVSSGDIAGCAVRVMRKDEVLFEDGFGFRLRELEQTELLRGGALARFHARLFSPSSIFFPRDAL